MEILFGIAQSGNFTCEFDLVGVISGVKQERSIVDDSVVTFSYYLFPRAYIPFSKVRTMVYIVNSNVLGYRCAITPQQLATKLIFQPETTEIKNPENVTVWFKTTLQPVLVEHVHEDVYIKKVDDQSVIYKHEITFTNIENKASKMSTFDRTWFQDANITLFVVDQFIMTIPHNAYSVKLYDTAGRINKLEYINTNTTERALSIKGRYPLFGGWRTSFTLAYDTIESSIPNKPFNISVVPYVEGMTVRMYTISFHLPPLYHTLSAQCTQYNQCKYMITNQSSLILPHQEVIYFEMPSINMEVNRQYVQIHYTIQSLHWKVLTAISLTVLISSIAICFYIRSCCQHVH